jgi:N-acetylmuramoyl-L-alanine amidase
VKKIFIDPGHGGTDAGASANGMKEKDLNLAIALKIRNQLVNKYTGFSLHLSRTTDTTKSLKQRTDAANKWKADFLLSIHINAGGGRGFESYIYNGSYSGKRETNRLRGLIHDQVIRSSGFHDRGKKEENFHMLRNSAMPSMLTENGCIDGGDAGNLKKDAFLEKVAAGHAIGLAEALGLAEKSGQQFHIVKAGDTLWSISVRHSMTVSVLFKLNPGVEPKYLQIGQKIRVK